MAKVGLAKVGFDRQTRVAVPLADISVRSPKVEKSLYPVTLPWTMSTLKLESLKLPLVVMCNFNSLRAWAIFLGSKGKRYT